MTVKGKERGKGEVRWGVACGVEAEWEELLGRLGASDHKNDKRLWEWVTTVMEEIRPEFKRQVSSRSEPLVRKNHTKPKKKSCWA